MTAEPQSAMGRAFVELMEVLPASTVEVVQAAAVPRRFDAELLAAMLGGAARPDVGARADERLAQLADMSFVQNVGPGLYVLHEAVRQLILGDLWAHDRGRYCNWSWRAAENAGAREDGAWQVESMYHWLIADPVGHDKAIWGGVANWHRTARYAHIQGFLAAAREHEQAGRLAGRDRSWLRYWEARLQQQQGNLKGALALLEDAMLLAGGDTATESRLMASLLASQGSVYMQLGELKQARRCYSQALPLHRSAGLRSGEGDCHVGLGDVARRWSNFKTARREYLAALALFDAAGDRMGKARATYGLGQLAGYTNQSQEALERYEQARVIYLELEHRAGAANCTRAMGDVWLGMPDYEKAKEHLQMALDEYLALGARIGAGNCLEALGDVARTQNDYASAEPYYHQALAIFREAGARQGIANGEYDLGRVALAAGLLDEAKKRFLTALRLYRELRDYDGKAATLLSLGDVAAREGRIDEAEKQYAAAQKVFQRARSEHGQRVAVERFRALHAEGIESQPEPDL